jgi:7,8-dihydropterin-6-yl-methyl-4-(beta-D-ribofuranosyl)aminobenzene 5'-phosphate synthase
MEALTELSSLAITVLVDNATDMISPPCACCDPQTPADDRVAAYTSESQWLVSRVKGGAAAAMDFSDVCFAGHGLSLLLEAEAQGRTHTLLFDAGPCGQLWTHNARSLDIDPGSIDAVVLSHWWV